MFVSNLFLGAVGKKPNATKIEAVFPRSHGHENNTNTLCQASSIKILNITKMSAETLYDKTALCAKPMLIEIIWKTPEHFFVRNKTKTRNDDD